MDNIETPRPPRPDIQEPSEESGGVPDPTPEYLQQTERESTRLESPQPLLIISDLNGTLLHRPDSYGNPRTAVPRPYAPLFIDYMIKSFWFAFWSSARPQNVRHMVNAIIHPENKAKLVAMWDRSRFGLTRDDYCGRTQCYKRLSLMWEDPDVARTHPHYETGGRWSQANTVLIDDTATKARSEPFNLIEIPEFADKQDKYDFVLPQVHDYINELAFQSDVSAYIRAHPFQPQEDPEMAFEVAQEDETTSQGPRVVRNSKRRRPSKLKTDRRRGQHEGVFSDSF
ncbi:uncharacterized protein SPSK_05505 [Sporothrix schenckii 1099-18]|uniref:Mitochondrial import inner membrane translocase subunit TIM50 n=2 Tax=Sporothrix schenckii TaxID=29908 RepID=U7Q3B6_SPOS1|nr:uncharacterized protein SPSK_05505 [Sporothrix schenckii 1099-18]ERT02353.1 hypothetical protein HMPREF1624_00651 [Sporothrix schenckii ATCC 58251]KJR80386.1 hypothetical protein SPSK_05505 [Sporothrix schenckii 1099-18]